MHALPSRLDGRSDHHDDVMTGVPLPENRKVLRIPEQEYEIQIPDGRDVEISELELRYTNDSPITLRQCVVLETIVKEAEQ
jgi:hypothetical protein